MHPENKKKDKPTTERLLKAFSKIILTLIKDQTGHEKVRFLTPLSTTQQEILDRFGLAWDLMFIKNLQINVFVFVRADEEYNLMLFSNSRKFLCLTEEIF